MSEIPKFQGTHILSAREIREEWFVNVREEISGMGKEGLWI